jgi:predicted phage terminase large subunit-like protein
MPIKNPYARTTSALRVLAFPAREGNPAMSTWIDDLERELLPGETDGGWGTSGELALALDPETRQTPALDKIDAALEELLVTPDGRLIVVMPPQEGKSQRVTRRFVERALKRNPNTRVAVCSYELNVARRWGRAVRDDITAHSDTFGLQVRRDLSGQSEWQLAGYDGGVFSVGIGGGLTGRPVDLMVIDDPIKDRDQADSLVYRDKVWSWWTDVANARLAPGAPVVLILTRWHEDDLAGRLLKAEDGHRWKVLRIPAQADHDPEKGETDPLDRAPEQFLESARGRTPAQWEAIKVAAGSRTWTALYQGRPAPLTGGMFPRTVWKQYSNPLWITREDGSKVVTDYDELLASWDLTFKDTKGTDLVAGQVWMRVGADVFLLDQVHARMDFVRTCSAVRQLSAVWPQALMKLIEDKANGPAVISSLSRIVPGIIPEEPDGSKTARAAAISPLTEAGNVWLPSPELAPWVGDFIEEAAGFPFGAHDDQVDAMSQALKRLVLQPLMSGLITAEDLEPDLIDHGSYVPG